MTSDPHRVVETCQEDGPEVVVDNLMHHGREPVMEEDVPTQLLYLCCLRLGQVYQLCALCNTNLGVHLKNSLGHGSVVCPMQHKCLYG